MTTHLSPTAEEDLLILEEAKGQEAVAKAEHFLETELEERTITRDEYDEILSHLHHEPKQ